MNETTENVIGKETSLERPSEVPSNGTIQQILDILYRNEQDTKFLLMVLMRAQSLERIKLGL